MLEGLKFEDILAVLELKVKSVSFEGASFEDILLSLISSEGKENVVSTDEGKPVENKALQLNDLLKLTGNPFIPQQISRIDGEGLKEVQEISKSERNTEPANLGLIGENVAPIKAFAQPEAGSKRDLNKPSENQKIIIEGSKDQNRPVEFEGREDRWKLDSEPEKGKLPEREIPKINKEAFFEDNFQTPQNGDRKGVQWHDISSQRATQDENIKMSLIPEPEKKKEFKKEVASGGLHDRNKGDFVTKQSEDTQNIEKPTGSISPENKKNDSPPDLHRDALLLKSAASGEAKEQSSEINLDKMEKISRDFPVKQSKDIQNKGKLIGSIPSENKENNPTPDQHKDTLPKRAISEGANIPEANIRRDTHTAETGSQVRDLFDRQAPLSHRTHVARDHSSKNGNPEGYQSWSPNTLEEINGIQSGGGEEGFVEEVQRREVPEHQVRSEAKQLNIRIEGANLRFRFHNSIFSVDIRVQEDLERSLSYLDVQRLSRSIQALGLNLETLRLNGVDLLPKNVKVGRREEKERVNIREDAGSGKETNSSLSDSSDFSLLL